MIPVGPVVPVTTLLPLDEVGKFSFGNNLKLNVPFNPLLLFIELIIKELIYYYVFLYAYFNSIIKKFIIE